MLTPVCRHDATIDAADRFFIGRTSLFDAMPTVWQRMTEHERRTLCSLFDSFQGKWDVENLKRVMLLGFVRLDDIQHLRGCYLTTKEDSSVFVNPLGPLEKVPEVKPNTKRQWMLDQDYHGFSFAPAHLLEPYKEDKEKKGSGSARLYESEKSMGLTAKLFVHMTNFVACNHGWHTGADLVPSSHLDVAITRDQVDLLNPTPRDVQIGAIIDQCTGRKAKKVIAKQRIDFVSGNVNSHACILNGPQQLSKIKTCGVHCSTAEREIDRMR